MQFDEMGNTAGKVLFLLPGTACDYQTNFAVVLNRLPVLKAIDEFMETPV